MGLWILDLRHPPSSPHPDTAMSSKLSTEQQVNEIMTAFNTSSWLRNHAPEPLVGDPLSPADVEDLGIKGMSCYTALVKKYDDNEFGCRVNTCRAFRVNSIEDGMRHLRYQHFDHRPFSCSTWSVWVTCFRSPPQMRSTNTPPFSKSLTDSLLQSQKLPRTERRQQSSVPLPIGSSSLATPQRRYSAHMLVVG
jgi:hypothetical protein